MKKATFLICFLALLCVFTCAVYAQEPTQSDTLTGDINGDGRVSIADIVLLNAYTKGKITTVDEKIKQKLDINRDGDINSTDVKLLQGGTLGHTVVIDAAIPATCTQNGLSEGMHCTKCDKVLVEQTTVEALGHDEVVDPGIKANSVRPGKTAGSHCAMCGEVLLEQAEIPAKGYHWMLADNEFKILLIGNSFSEDASSCGSGMTQSQLYHILQNMLGEDIKITLGLLYSGGKGVHWFATQTEQKTNAASFYVITPESNVWTRHGSSTTQNALAWTDWDVVTLQPYDINFSTEQEAVPYPAGTDQKFYKLEAATEYMLDCIDSHAPQADVYCYMHWARSGSSSSTLNASLNVYQKFASFYPKTLGYVGTTSGNRSTNLIQV
ncbi:MAG: hypothetical protein IJY66_01490, partial [Clostridia bacterium]|nr:hypothetical protein [Clostridia bacterium]